MNKEPAGNIDNLSKSIIKIVDAFAPNIEQRLSLATILNRHNNLVYGYLEKYYKSLFPYLSDFVFEDFELKGVTLMDYQEDHLPEFPEGVDNILILECHNIEEIEDLPMIKELSISCCPELKSIKVPPSLEVLDLYDLNSLHDLENQEGVEVKISLCPKIKIVEKLIY